MYLRKKIWRQCGGDFLLFFQCGWVMQNSCFCSSSNSFIVNMKSQELGISCSGQNQFHWWYQTGECILIKGNYYIYCWDPLTYKSRRAFCFAERWVDNCWLFISLFCFLQRVWWKTVVEWMVKVVELESELMSIG